MKKQTKRPIVLTVVSGVCLVLMTAFSVGYGVTTNYQDVINNALHCESTKKIEVKSDKLVDSQYFKPSFTDKTDTDEANGTGYTATIADGDSGAKIVSVNFGQMGTKDFTVSADDYAKLRSGVATITKAEVASSDEANPFILEFHDDGGVTTGWMKYAQTLKNMSWEMSKGSLVLNDNGTGYTATVAAGEDGAMNVTVNFGQMGEKTFVLSADEYAKLTATVKTITTSEVETSVEGKPFVLQFNDDGSITAGWTNYEQTLKTMSWTYTDGTLTINPMESTYTVTVADGENGAKTVTVNFGQMGDKVFTVTAEQLALLA